MGFSFPKERRLCGKSAVERVFAHGEGGFVYPLRWLAVSADEFKVLVGVPKKLHKRAVMRNLLKRRMREAFRLSFVAGGRSVHLALLYAAREEEDFARIKEAVEKILGQLRVES